MQASINGLHQRPVRLHSSRLACSSIFNSSCRALSLESCVLLACISWTMRSGRGQHLPTTILLSIIASARIVSSMIITIIHIRLDSTLTRRRAAPVSAWPNLKRGSGRGRRKYGRQIESKIIILSLAHSSSRSRRAYSSLAWTGPVGQVIRAHEKPENTGSVRSDRRAAHKTLGWAHGRAHASGSLAIGHSQIGAKATL